MQVDEKMISYMHEMERAGVGQRQIAANLGCSQSTVNKYLAIAAEKAPPVIPATYPLPPGPKERANVTVRSGIVLVGSDMHYWPSEAGTTAHRGFCLMANLLNPDVIVANGDVMDGARVSKHASIGWEKRPQLFQELTEAQARMQEIVDNSPTSDHIWTLGNHDMRFETRLAAVAPEYANIQGMHLKDHFPHWQPCWSVWINGNTVIKHRFKGGEHAAFNNVVRSGYSVVTGHTHRCLVVPYSDYSGARYGIECGTLAEPYGEQFIHYTEDNPCNWQSGFAVLSYADGLLLPPELAVVVGPDKIAFRGKVFQV